MRKTARKRRLSAKQIWSQVEFDFLYQHRQRPLEWLAAQLNRTADSVKAKLYTLPDRQDRRAPANRQPPPDVSLTDDPQIQRRLPVPSGTKPVDPIELDAWYQSLSTEIAYQRHKRQLRQHV